LQRNLLTRLSQATNGNRALQISLAADYEVSKFLTVSAYYDRQSNQPLLTSSAYPSTMQDFGINLKFQLTR
jgi:gliding motility-related protein